MAAAAAARAVEVDVDVEAGLTPPVRVPPGAALVAVGGRTVSCGRMAEQIDNEAIDMEVMAHDLKANAVELAKSDVGAQFLAKKDEILGEWQETQQEWEELAGDVKEIRPQMAAVDEKLEAARVFYEEKTKATSDKISKRNDELEEGDQQLDEVLSRAENVVKNQDRMKAMCGGGGSTWRDRRSCLFLIMALLLVLSVIIAYSFVSKFM